MPAETAASSAGSAPIGPLAEWLAEIVGADRVATDEHAIAAHGRDEGYARRGRKFTADAVVFPRTTREVAAIVTQAARLRVPITAWGAGTSLEGNSLPTRGGIVLDTTSMGRVVATYPGDLQVVVQAGVLRPDLNDRLREHGLFFPPDPGVPSTIGGMVGNNSSGTKSVKYGVTKDYVLGLEVVLADGRVIRTGSRAVKSASGYDLTSLFIGSEGTLGIVSEITLRLAPWPTAVQGALARFESIDAAAQAVSTLISSGALPSTAELLDERTVALMNLDGLAWPVESTLLLEFDGPSDRVVEEEAALAAEIVADGGGRFELVPIDRHRTHVDVRHTIGHAVFRSSAKPNLKTIDVTVPISRFPDLVRGAYVAINRAGLEGHVLGHAGDGNLHVLLLGDARDEEEWARVEEAEEAIVVQAIALEGTTTGEHGVGLGRKRFMQLEHGAGVDVMRAIKGALDPDGLLNPDKIFDAEAT